MLEGKRGYLFERLNLTFDNSESVLCYAQKHSMISLRIDADFYSPRFTHFRRQIEDSVYPTVQIGEICKSISSGFAAGKQDQADDLPDNERVPQLRPFSITPYGQISFATKKYVPISRLQEKDYCKKGEVLYARYDEIVELSYPHPGYQRPVDDVHVGEISMFITSGSNSFSPEVVLAYTAKYDYYKEGAVSGIDAIADIRNGNGFTSNIDGISFKKIRKVNNGYLYEISIPYEKKLIDEEKPFRRVDGNHRLQAMEQLVSTGQISSTYLIPFCLILFADTDSLKDEKVIFHNINSKAVPLKSEQLLKSVLIQQHDGLDFNDRELIEKFGPEYLLARKILSANPLIVRKLGYIEWIHPRILSTLVDLINYVQEKSGTRIETLEQQEALINSLNNTLRHAHPLGAATLQMASGLLFLLVYMYYQMENGELDPQNKAEKEKNQLIAWAEKYNITDAQHDIEQYAAVNADCIRAIFDKYVLSTEQTIFMSRCFDSRFDENERAIRRAIECVNREKGSSLRLLRVDQHSEGATGQISDRILRDIEMSGLVIADLSSGRANIPHEIGFAMGLKKGLILIHNGTDAEADEHTPSNIKMYEQIRFNQDYHKLETELKAKLIDYYKL